MRRNFENYIASGMSKAWIFNTRSSFDSNCARFATQATWYGWTYVDAKFAIADAKKKTKQN